MFLSPATTIFRWFRSEQEPRLHTWASVSCWGLAAQRNLNSIHRNWQITEDNASLTFACFHFRECSYISRWLIKRGKTYSNKKDKDFQGSRLSSVLFHFLQVVDFLYGMRLLCLDICFAARRLCQRTSRRLLLALVGRPLERLKPWQWLSCFKHVSGDSLTKQACAIGPKAPVKCKQRANCSHKQVVLFFHPWCYLHLFKTWCYPNIPPFELLSWQLVAVIHLFVWFSFADNRSKINTEDKMWSLTPRHSLVLFSLTINDNQWDSSPNSMQRQEDWLVFSFEILFPNSFSSHNMFTYLLQKVTRCYWNKCNVPHVGEFDVADSS